ncbi:MAG TPA: hypothetical protein P5528_12640 [Steroidobacteraceae bacterium]|nr:hypothetical protein [Steroidobacteraceae bacterium]HRX90282.1 hypothetical protein [Steroidobacteraceae bacterium]
MALNRTTVCVATLASLCVLGACTALPPPEPRSHLDERTGVTLTVVDQPLVFARERRDIAANVRDYITLVAVERDQAGKFTLALIAYRWSTIDKRVNDESLDANTKLVIVADGRDIRLEPLADELPADLQGDPRLLPPAAPEYATTAYQVDAATLTFIATSANLSAFYEDATQPLSFALWNDARDALAHFARDRH